MRMTSIELACATGGQWIGDPPSAIQAIATDSRTIRSGEAFLALRGTRFDGHRFGKAAEAGGACALIGDAEGVQLWQDIDLPKLVVKDTLKALGDIAAAWRRRLSSHVIAITGSVGKTTVRSMLESIFNAMHRRVCASPGNLNNLIGVPLSLLRADEEDEFVLIECGISKTGEMHRLGEIVQPDSILITAIAFAHGEGLGDIDGIRREKFELVRHLRSGGVCILGHNVAIDPDVAHGDHGIDLLPMDKDPRAVRWHLENQRLTLIADANEKANLQLDLPAEHWAQNMALAATAARRLGLGSLLEIAKALRAWHPVAGRMTTLRGPGGSILIDDTYNANPASMKAALDTLRKLPGRRFAILGDMAELGEESIREHLSLDLSGLASAILVGSHLKAVASHFSNARWIADVDTAAHVAKRWHLGEGDIVLVKGSRSMGMERVIALLSERCHAV